jgi:zinc/manganese transport system substrate-binding protein
MKRRVLLRTGLAGACGLALGAGRAVAAGPPPLKVVATFSILADMVRQIGGNAVEVTSLVPVDGDAHEYQPRPSDLRSLTGAALLVRNGLGLEGWMDRLAGAAGYQGPVVVASEGVAPRRMEEGGALATDPHAWQDPRNGLIYASNIEAGLVKADPARAALWHKNAAIFRDRIGQTDAWIAAQIQSVPPAARKILTSHDAFGYFGARFGIEFHGVTGINTAIEPSAAAFATLVKLVRQEGIHAVFVENMTSPRLARALASETGAVLGPTVYSDALSAAGGPAPTYLAIFRHNVPLFVQAMQANPVSAG